MELIKNMKIRVNSGNTFYNSVQNSPSSLCYQGEGRFQGTGAEGNIGPKMENVTASRKELQYLQTYSSSR
jgi:hypothetical protein